MTDQARTHEDPALVPLMQQLQELLEAKVIGLVLEYPNGRYALTCPSERRDEVHHILQHVRWPES